ETENGKQKAGNGKIEVGGRRTKAGSWKLLYNEKSEIEKLEMERGRPKAGNFAKKYFYFFSLPCATLACATLPCAALRLFSL
ncbi:MAG: hypothetical protein RR393_05325, partial [Bacteroidales bacterium]